jgi:hypothetical protein
MLCPTCAGWRAKGGYTFSYVDPDWWIFLIFDMLEESGVDTLLDSLVAALL